MREHIDTLRLSRYIAGLDETARRAGIEIEIRTDFGHLMELCEGLPDKPAPAAMFDPMKADIGGHNGFWLKGCDTNGVPVHVQAARVYDMNGTNLGREISSLRAFYANPRLAPEGERCTCAAPMLERVSAHAHSLGSFIATITNPKSLLFFAAFLPQFVDSSSPAVPQYLMLAALFFIAATPVGLAYALSTEWLTNREGPLGRISALAPRLAGLCLIALGATSMARIFW